jgi:hypothetical protein
MSILKNSGGIPVHSPNSRYNDAANDDFNTHPDIRIYCCCRDRQRGDKKEYESVTAEDIWLLTTLKINNII